MLRAGKLIFLFPQTKQEAKRKTQWRAGKKCLATDKQART